MLSKISVILDSIADRLESQGFIKEASEVDVISNTLEAATRKPLFDGYGNFFGTIPQQAVLDCSGPGRADEGVKYWRNKLNFEVPRQKAVQYLREFGSWTVDELNEMDDIELAEKVLWIACGEIRENGEWLGLIH